MKFSLLAQYAGQISKLLFAFSVGAWTARYLGPSKYGLLGYALTLVSIVEPIGSLGIQSSLPILLCLRPQPPRLLETALATSLLAKVLMLAIILPIGLASNNTLLTLLALLAYTGSLFRSTDVFEADFLHKNSGTYLGKIEILNSVLQGVLSCIAILFGAPLFVFGVIQVISSAAKAIMLSTKNKLYLVFANLRLLNIQTAQALISKGVPIMASSLSILIYMKSDILMLEWFSTSSEVGTYSVSTKLAEMFYFLPVILNRTYFPRIGNHIDLSPHARPPIITLYQITLMIGLAIFFLNLCIVPFLIPLFFGSQYIAAQNQLIALAPSSIAVCIGCATMTWLNHKGYSRTLLARSLIGAILNIILNVYLIPLHGAIGAGIATTLAQFASVYCPFLWGNCDIRANLILTFYPCRALYKKS